MCYCLFMNIKKTLHKLQTQLRLSYQNPHFLARSNMIGMSLAFAPFPGQVPVVAALWLLLRRSKWRFSLTLFTNLPLFYLYYLTGNFLRGITDPLPYSQITLQTFKDNLGVNFLLGSLFYMILFAFIGYGSGWIIHFCKRESNS